MLTKEIIEKARDLFESIKDNKANVLDGTFNYIGFSTNDIVMRVVINEFDSYNFLKEKGVDVKEPEAFFTLLEDNIGKDDKEINDILSSNNYYTFI